MLIYIIPIGNISMQSNLQLYVGKMRCFIATYTKVMVLKKKKKT